MQSAKFHEGGPAGQEHRTGIWCKRGAHHQRAQGRLFTEAEDRGLRRVVVLGALGTDSQALRGQEIRIRGITFEVVGVGGIGIMNIMLVSVTERTRPGPRTSSSSS